MKKYFVLFLLVFGILPFSQAQQHQYSWKIGVHGGFATYYGDLSHQFFDVHHKMKAPFQNLDFWAYGLSLEYHVSKTFGIKLMGFKSQIVSNDRTYSDNGNFNRALNVQTDLIDVSLLGVIYLDNGRIFGHKAVISPYFLIGGGLTYFDAKADLLAADGNRYYYWSDKTIRNLDEADPNANMAAVIDLDNKYETTLLPLKTEGYQYLPVTWHVAAGLGFKFRLSKRFHLHLEAVLRYTGTDYLDDVSGDYLPYYADNVQGYAANPSNDSRSTRGSTPDMNDWTGYIALSLHYSFGQKTYDIRPSIIYTPSILVTDAVSLDSSMVVNKNNADTTTNNSTNNDSTNTNTALIADTTNLKDSLSLAAFDSTQKNDTIANQKLDSVAILWNNSYNKNVSNEVHDLQLENLELGYEYQLKLLKQEYEYELKIQALGHQLELEKLKKSQPQESYEKDLQKLKYEQDLKLQKQDYEYQLKLKGLEHALALEKIQPSTNTVTHVITTEEHRNSSNNSSNNTSNNGSNTNSNNNGQNNANNNALQQRLDKLLLAMEQQQKLLDALLNLERNTASNTASNTTSKNENNTSNASDTSTNSSTNFNTNSSTSTNTKELEHAKAQNNILQAQIEVLEQALKQSISKDSTNNRVSNSEKEKDLQNQLHQQTAQNKDLSVQLAKANLQNNQQKELIDSLLIELLIKINELESAQKNISNELGKFLNKESSTHITKIYFAVNKTNLSIQAEETLAALAQHLKNYPDVRYWVKGFASRKGDATRNEQLSKERAVVVAAYLEQLGIQKDRLKITSLGSSQSVLDNDVDRRAEVHLYFE